MEKISLKKYIRFACLYLLILSIPFVLTIVFKLDYIFFFGFVLFSLLPFIIILGILLRTDMINNIKSIYKKYPHLSAKRIASRSGTSEDMVLYILTKIKRKEESSQFKVIQKASTSSETKVPPESFIENTFKNTNRIRIDDKCEVNLEGKEMRISINKNEQKSSLYLILFFLVLFLISTFLAFQLPITALEGGYRFLLIIVWVMMLFLDGYGFYGLFMWFHSKNRIIEFIVKKNEKVIIQQKVSPKHKFLNNFVFSQVKGLNILRKSTQSSAFFILKLIFHDRKKIRIFKSNTFGNCRDLGKIIASFLQIPITSKYYSDFI